MEVKLGNFIEETQSLLKRDGRGPGKWIIVNTTYRRDFIEQNHRVGIRWKKAVINQ